MHNDAVNPWTFGDSTSRSPHRSVWARNNSIMYLYKGDIYNPTIPYKLQNGCENVMLATSKRDEKKDSFNFMYGSRD